MSTPTRERCCEAIRRTLMHRAGDALDASVVAEATLGILQQIADQLTPVIGSRGVDALFRRSLHLTRTSLPWLAQSEVSEESTALLASLKAGLSDLEPKAALEASHALLMTFTKLLTSLIGKSLTKRLLSLVWVPLSPASEKESKSCITK